MGLFDMISSAFGWSKKEARILVIGLDNSGKTTLINHIKPKKVLWHGERNDLRSLIISDDSFRRQLWRLLLQLDFKWRSLLKTTYILLSTT